jgi:hypothetical protein
MVGRRGDKLVVSFEASLAGTYEVRADAGGKAVKGSPFRVLLKRPEDTLRPVEPTPVRARQKILRIRIPNSENGTLLCHPSFDSLSLFSPQLGDVCAHATSQGTRAERPHHLGSGAP